MPARPRPFLLGLTLASVFATGAIADDLPRLSQRTKGRPPARAGRPSATPPRRGGPLAARWIGQDGHDFAGGAKPGEGGNDVQDIHVVLQGIPAGREVAHAIIGGKGGDEWEFNGKRYTPWTLVVHRRAGATSADLFLEPTRVEKGREFHLRLRFDDGSTAELFFQGRTADPNLRTAEAALQVEWKGQGGDDLTGPGMAVGPDGLQDVRLELAKLSPGVEVKSIDLVGPAGAAWHFGINPKGLANAEFVRRAGDTSAADFYFQPTADLAGKPLRMTIAYANGKSDLASVRGGKVKPDLAMPSRPLPTFLSHSIACRWLGQDGARPTGRGEVHVAVSGLPAGREVVAAALGDFTLTRWAYRAEGGPQSEVWKSSRPLEFRLAPDKSRADLFFAPERDESGAKMTLLLVFKDGVMAAVDFPGGACDPSLRAAGIGAGTASAKPGDDLHALVLRPGTVRLAKGTYRLDRPLVLDEPVALVGEPGTTLEFSQKGGDPPWTAAIKVHRSHTALRGFAVRFTGPIRWKEGISYGPAVIGATDNFDKNPGDPKFSLEFSGLDLQSPPSPGPSRWTEDTSLIRMANASSGKVVGNILKGGLVEVFSGPWEIAENDYRGTQPGTFAHAAFATHYGHDILVRANRARPVGPSGKTWRFLVMTGTGVRDRVEDNVSQSIGPRDDDTIPPNNEPEIILTEAYTLHFEGKPAAISADRRVVSIERPQGTPAGTGSVVSVLQGPGAGEWRRVAHAIDANTYLLDAPLPEGTTAISISLGFVDETFARNTIEARDAKAAEAMVLAGNHFGTRVLQNKFIGAGEAFKFVAAPSERPVIWSWSHAPFLGGVIEGNTVEDSERGGLIGVEHHPAMKSNAGRVYMSVTLRDNTVRWSKGFLLARSKSGAPGPPPGITLGYLPSFDPGELVVREQGSRSEAPAGMRPMPALKILAAQVNGKRLPRSGPAPPAATSPVGRARTRPAEPPR